MDVPSAEGTHMGTFPVCRARGTGHAARRLPVLCNAKTLHYAKRKRLWRAMYLT
jgi:hypothetical protein